MHIEELTRLQYLDFCCFEILVFYCLFMCHCHALLYTKIEAHHFFVLLIIRSCSFAGLSVQFALLLPMFNYRMLLLVFHY
jgi:hypothetical protein